MSPKNEDPAPRANAESRANFQPERSPGRELAVERKDVAAATGIFGRLSMPTLKQRVLTAPSDPLPSGLSELVDDGAGSFTRLAAE